MIRDPEQPAHASIAITGTGLVTALGLDRETTWRRVCAGDCGIRSLTAVEQALDPDKGGGQAPDPPGDEPHDTPRAARYLKMAILQALHEASAVDALPYPPRRCGIMLGTTLHGMRAAGRHLREDSPAPLRHFLAPAILEAALDGIDVRGIAITTCAACASGLSSVGLALTMLRRGDLDLVIAGGYDVISEYAYAGFSSLRLVAEGRMRPFCHDREGMKLGEGYGIVVLERVDEAIVRGATPHAIVAGFGESADAHHLTHPHPEGDGAARAMHAALDDAGIGPEHIGMIAAHATGTPDNDACEYRALARVFGDRMSKVPVVAFKSHLGHTLGGAGAVEMILSACALRDRFVPPTANVRAEDVEFEPLRVGGVAVPDATIGHTLNLSIGFGGSNACLVLRRATDAVPEPSTSRPTGRRMAGHPGDEVVVTGVGVVVPGAIGNEAFRTRIFRDAVDPIATDLGMIPDAALTDLLSARRVRRMSDYVKLTLAASTVAWHDARIDDPEAFAAGCRAMLGTTHGSATYSGDFYEQIVRGGIVAANPMLFAESVPNSGAAHLSLMLSLKRECQTIIGSRTAGLEALHLAVARIASGEWDRALVGAADENAPLIRKAYGHFGLHDGDGGGPAEGNGHHGFRCGCGGVTFVLESRQSAEARGARVRGVIESGATARTSSPDPRTMRRAIREILRDLGEPDRVLIDGNGTWLERIEMAVLRSADPRRRPNVSSVYDAIAECFSAAPLAAMAAVLLEGRLPRPLSVPGNGPYDPTPAHDEEQVSAFGVLALDYTGLAAGVRARVEHVEALDAVVSATAPAEVST